MHVFYIPNQMPYFTKAELMYTWYELLIARGLIVLIE